MNIDIKMEIIAVRTMREYQAVEIHKVRIVSPIKIKGKVGWFSTQFLPDVPIGMAIESHIKTMGDRILKQGGKV